MVELKEFVFEDETEAQDPFGLGGMLAAECRCRFDLTATQHPENHLEAAHQPRPSE